MKKLTLVFTSLLATVGGFSSEDTLITPELTELLELTNVQCEKDNLSSITEATRKAWMRPDTKERWEIVENLPVEKQKRIVELCDQIGMLSEKAPQATHYRYCLIIGSALPTVKMRMQYVGKLWEKGVRFDEIVFLTGDRSLDEKVDRLPLLSNLPSNEAEGMLAIYKALSLPQELKDLPLTVVNVPKTSTDKGLRRPGTHDTVLQWLQNNPEPGSCLFLSSQPYVAYQNAIVRDILPKEFDYEFAGPAASLGYHLRPSLLLDNISRWLAQESQQ